MLSALQLTSMFPNLVFENFYIKTKHSIDDGQRPGAVRLRRSRVQRDMTRAATLVNVLRAQGIEVGTLNAEIDDRHRHVPGRLVRHQAQSAVRPPREESARAAGLSRIPRSRRTTTAAGRWATRSTST